MASIDRTAYPRLKRLVSARELADAFTPTSDEAEWARGRTQTEQNVLALVVLLKCYQRLGYFPRLPDVPHNLSQVGDVVTYTNTGGTPMLSWDGYGDWNVPWSTWQSGGVLPALRASSPPRRRRKALDGRGGADRDRPVVLMLGVCRFG